MRVSREFKQHFDLVAKHFGLEGDDLDAAKEAVRRDPEGAATCYAAMGNWVRQQSVVPAIQTSLPVITRDEIDARRPVQSPARAGMAVPGVRKTIK